MTEAEASAERGGAFIVGLVVLFMIFANIYLAGRVAYLSSRLDYVESHVQKVCK